MFVVYWQQNIRYRVTTLSKGHHEELKEEPEVTGWPKCSFDHCSRSNLGVVVGLRFTGIGTTNV